MIFNEILMYVMALGVILGGLDRICGNRFGLGAKFEEGFLLMGPIALSMAGIVCLTPAIGQLSGLCLSPLLGKLSIDPAICGGILPVDAGGYQLAAELAADGKLGQFAGVIVGATFGCCLTFVIPVGMGALEEEHRQDFAMGLLVGLITLPAALMVGGLLCGLSLGTLLYQSLPVLLLSAALLAGLLKNRGRTLRGFAILALIIRVLSTLGIMVSAVRYLTGWDIPIATAPLEEALATVCAIAIVLLGCLPMAELLKRALKGFAVWIGKKTGMNASSSTAMLVGIIIAMPALTMLKDMDRRGRVVNGALMVCGASAFSAHLGFVLGVAPEMVGPMLAAKLTGAVLAAVAALIVTKSPVP